MTPRLPRHCHWHIWHSLSHAYVSHYISGSASSLALAESSFIKLYRDAEIAHISQAFCDLHRFLLLHDSLVPHLTILSTDPFISLHYTFLSAFLLDLQSELCIRSRTIKCGILECVSHCTHRGRVERPWDLGVFLLVDDITPNGTSDFGMTFHC